MSWIQTYTGRRFFPLSPSMRSICIEDIAHALSNVCRFGGHCRRFYSVAEHSVWVSMKVAPEHALWGLLHDAAEAYLGDQCRPIKRHLRLGDERFTAAEAFLLSVISQVFCLPPMPEEVHEVDDRMLMTEAAQLFGPKPANLEIDPEPYPDVDLREMCGPGMAEAAFLHKFRVLDELRRRSDG